MQLFDRLIAAFFPPHCLLCRRRIVTQKQFCNDHLQFLNKYYFCKSCSPFELINETRELIHLNTTPIVMTASSATKILLTVNSLFPYREPLSSLLWQYKYQGNQMLSRLFSELLYQALFHWFQPSWLSSIDLIVAVPSAKSSLYHRGFSHIHLLASHLSRYSAIPYRPFALTRTRDVTPQIELSFKERLTNVRNVFSASSRDCSGKSVLLLDDVATSGATLLDSSRALIDSGAKYIYAVTLMHTEQNSSIKKGIYSENHCC